MTSRKSKLFIDGPGGVTFAVAIWEHLSKSDGKEPDCD
jgi:hypothetical protein